MLSLLRNIPSAVEHVKKGNWSRMEHKGHELKGKTLCILGMGRLGIQIARMATAFQMNIKCFDNKNIQEYPCTTNLTKALHKSDILTIHLPYDPSTSGLIGEKQILEVKGDWSCKREGLRPGGWAFQCLRVREKGKPGNRIRLDLPYSGRILGDE